MRFSSWEEAVSSERIALSWFLVNKLLLEIQSLRKREGFWAKSEKTVIAEHLPFPLAHKKPWKGRKVFLSNLKEVEEQTTKVRVEHMKGISVCRLCGKGNGSAEYSFNGWTWPVGLLHYVKMHNVRPSEEFIKFIEVETDIPF